MYKTALLFLLLAFLTTNSLNAQDTIKTRPVTAKYFGSQEVYNVRLSNDHIWHGKFTYTYGKVILIEGSYFNDRMDGEWKYYYPSGKLKFHVLYDHGVYIKSLGSYYENGTLQSSDSVSGKKEFVKIFTEKGKLFRDHILFNGLQVKKTYYYPESGKLRMVITLEADTSMEHITTYYENGQVRSVVENKSRRRYNGLGCFDPEGKSIDQGNLKDGNGLLKTYQDTSVVILQSELEFKDQQKEGQAIFYQTNGKVGRRGAYQGNKRVGKWTFYKQNGTLDFARDFNSPTDKGWEYKEMTLPADRPYPEMDLPVEFAGGEKNLKLYLDKNITFPKHEDPRSVHRGIVEVSFDVNVDGIAEHIRVEMRLKNPDFENEMIRIVKIMPRWIPGFVDGKPQTIRYYLPVLFSL